MARSREAARCMGQRTSEELNVIAYRTPKVTLLDAMRANAAHEELERRNPYMQAVRAALKAGAAGDEAEWHRLAAIAKAIKEAAKA